MLANLNLKPATLRKIHAEDAARARFAVYIGHLGADPAATAREILAILEGAFGLEPLRPAYRGEVAHRWRYLDGAGEVGVITSITEPFCGDCSRARLSPEGELYTCLFASRGHDLRALLRSDKSDEEISAFVSSVWRIRDDRYSEIRTSETSFLPKVEMSHIGG